MAARLTLFNPVPVTLKLVAGTGEPGATVILPSVASVLFQTTPPPPTTRFCPPTTAGLKTLSLRLIAQGPSSAPTEQLLYLDGAVIDFGREIQVSIGPDAEARTVFTGFISAIEAD